MGKVSTQNKSRASRVLRRIPAVDSILRREDVRRLMEKHGRGLVTEAVREAVETVRRDLAGSSERAGAPDFEEHFKVLMRETVARMTASSLRRVINATGVVIHTNLGRAPLSEEARDRVARVAASYCTLEYDLEEGRRGSRSAHLESRLSFLFPGRASLAVNNNAAAVFLALNTLAEGREVIISRGELVEIGGSFRIPDVMAKSGARLREVGTTNRTRLADYEAAIGPETGLILKVHTSNYRIVGFTQEAGVAELAELAHRHDLKLMVDQGSGSLQDMSTAGIKDEPTVGWVLDQGADLVTFSGDKVLGGPQAGIATGDPDPVQRMMKSPLYRVLRLDKMTIAALEATLDAYMRGTEKTEVPAARMIFSSRDAIGERARRLATALGDRLGGSFQVETLPGVSRIGGGAAPAEELPTVLVGVRTTGAGAPGPDAWHGKLRGGPVPVIARVSEGALLLDLRTVAPSEEGELIEMLVRGLSGG